jgi:hypothetical protein
MNDNMTEVATTTFVLPFLISVAALLSALNSKRFLVSGARPPRLWFVTVTLHPIQAVTGEDQQRNCQYQKRCAEAAQPGMRFRAQDPGAGS